MEIWLIRDGEKSGPFPDYEIRSRIITKDLNGSIPAWHEGRAEWAPLSEIPIFENEFAPPKPPEPEPVPEATSATPATPPPLPGKPRILRRFWARWFDIYLFIGIWWFIFWLARRDIGAMLFNPVVTLTQIVPWVVIEILLIHRFATTPGKWLLGIRVLNADGTNLTLAQSTRRALRAYAVGIGLGIPYIVLFCMGLSAYTASKVKATVWDHLGGHRIASSRLSPWKIGALIVLFYGALQLQFGVVSPHVMKIFTESLSTPEAKPLREYLEKNPPWSLPRRHP